MSAEKQFKLSLVIRAVDKASSVFRAFGSNANSFAKDSKKISDTVGKGFAGFNALRLGIAGLFATLAGAGAAAFTGNMIEAGDAMDKLAKKTGFARDEIFSLVQVGKEAGIEGASFGSSLETFSKNIGQVKFNRGRLNTLLKNISPGLQKQLKGANGTEEAFQIFVKALDRVKDSNKKAALAAAGFGSADILNILEDGSEGLAKLRAATLATFGSQEKFIQGAVAADDAIDSLGSKASATARKFYAELFPSIATVTNAFSNLFVSGKSESTGFGDTLKGYVLDAFVKMKPVVVYLTGVFFKWKPFLEGVLNIAVSLVKVFVFLLKPVKLLFDMFSDFISLLDPVSAFLTSLVKSIAELASGIKSIVAGTFSFDSEELDKGISKIKGAFAGDNSPFKAFKESREKQIVSETQGMAAVSGSDFFRDIEKERFQIALNKFENSSDAKVSKAQIVRPGEIQREILNRQILNTTQDINSTEKNELLVNFKNVPRGTEISPKGSLAPKVKVKVGYISELER